MNAELKTELARLARGYLAYDPRWQTVPDAERPRRENFAISKLRKLYHSRSPAVRAAWLAGVQRNLAVLESGLLPKLDLTPREKEYYCSQSLGKQEVKS